MFCKKKLLIVYFFTIICQKIFFSIAFYLISFLKKKIHCILIQQNPSSQYISVPMHLFFLFPFSIFSENFVDIQLEYYSLKQKLHFYLQYLKERIKKCEKIALFNNKLFSFFAGDNKILQRIISSWGEMFSSSAIHTQTTALGEGVKQCTVGRSTIATITTRDWQVINYTLRMGKNSKKCSI